MDHGHHPPGLHAHAPRMSSTPLVHTHLTSEPFDGGRDLWWVLCVLRPEDVQVCSRFCLIEDGDDRCLFARERGRQQLA
eukprot:3523164-Prymnesium_polylepis.1